MVRFKTEEEVWITQKLSVGYSNPLAEESKVRIIYDPDEPTNIKIDITFQFEVIPRLFLAIGTIGLVLSLLDMVEVINVLTFAQVGLVSGHS